MKCGRVNLFIGEPNVGKSNILEALALFAFPLTGDLNGLVRFNDLSNLFFDNTLDAPITISGYPNGSCSINYDTLYDGVKFYFENKEGQKLTQLFKLSEFKGGGDIDFNVRPYFFKTLKRFEKKRPGFLHPPHGENLFTVLQTNAKLRDLISSFLDSLGYKLNFRPSTSELELAKVTSRSFTTIPFHAISDTIQRLIFFLSAIESNPKGATLIFEEPESNIFPYYTKFLAEKMALTEHQQFFISTHNPIFLQSVIEKTKQSDLTIYLVETIQGGYETKASLLNESAVEEILNLGVDVFLNFDHLLSE
ncbi:MAG: ATP-binding protein [Cyclobacteriaceae bacterium]|nr:ATP-binding protein [Cyclobacteriaceae bacterium]